VPFHARIIAATNVDLEQAVEDGKFRQDLYFRVSAQEVFVPPLRERKGDIKLLSYHFLEKYNQLCQRNVKSIRTDALRQLEAHDWKKNNVRELEREIQRAVVRAGEETELTPDLLFWKRGRQAPPSKHPTTDFDELHGLPYAKAKDEVRKRFARRYVLRKLEESHWNQKKAAELSGMQPSNFHRLMKQLDLIT
jgi:transcriptional regulator with GAF, ATPase, and Fis domain